MGSLSRTTAPVSNWSSESLRSGVHDIRREHRRPTYNRGRSTAKVPHSGHCTRYRPSVLLIDQSPSSGLAWSQSGQNSASLRVRAAAGPALGGDCWRLIAVGSRSGCTAHTPSSAGRVRSRASGPSRQFRSRVRPRSRAGEPLWPRSSRPGRPLPSARRGFWSTNGASRIAGWRARR